MTILTTSCNGIINGDMIIKTAIEAAIDDLRDDPWLLDFCFQFYLNDELTQKHFGAKQIEYAKDYFLNNEVEVRLDVAATQSQVPTITIKCADGSESWTTLGDTAETPSESLDVSQIFARNPTLTFTPKSFDATNGTIVLSSKHNTQSVWVGMRVLDTINSQTYIITDVVDDKTFIIDCDPAAPPNLKGAQVIDKSDLWVVQLLSATQRETYTIEVECQGEPINVLVVHSVLMFMLYRYKMSLLHKRGFENVRINKSGLTGPYSPGDSQLFFKRGITISGEVTNTWPGEIRPAIQGVDIDLSVLVEGSGKTYADDDEGEPGLTDQGWRIVDPELGDSEDE